MKTSRLIPIAILVAALPLFGQNIPAAASGPAPLEVTLDTAPCAPTRSQADAAASGCKAARRSFTRCSPAASDS